MGQYNFNVDLEAMEAINIIKQKQTADLLYEEIINVDGNKLVGVLIFEKYYFRAENRAGLTVIVSNINGVTEVKSIASGSSKGVFFGFDWGAGDDFAYSVNKILKNYII